MSNSPVALDSRFWHNIVIESKIGRFSILKFTPEGIFLLLVQECPTDPCPFLKINIWRMVKDKMFKQTARVFFIKFLKKFLKKGFLFYSKPCSA